MASDEVKRDLARRIYALRPGDIDAAIDLAADLIAADYWTRETAEMVGQTVVTNAKQSQEYLSRLATLKA